MRRSVLAAALLVAAVLPLALPGALARAGSDTDPWGSLRRPLEIARKAPGAACSVTPARAILSGVANGQGPGPIYPIGAAGGLQFIYPVASSQLWYPSEWSGNKILWVARPDFDGRVLVRGRQIDGPHRLRFGNGSMPSLELRLTLDARARGEGGWLSAPSFTRVRAAGCYAWQVDGASFSRVIAFRAIRVR